MSLDSLALKWEHIIKNLRCPLCKISWKPFLKNKNSENPYLFIKGKCFAAYLYVSAKKEDIWVLVSSISKISCHEIRELRFNFYLYQKLIECLDLMIKKQLLRMSGMRWNFRKKCYKTNICTIIKHIFNLLIYLIKNLSWLSFIKIGIK